MSERARPTPVGVNELVLEVQDLERAVRFYTEELGLPLVERWDRREAAWVMVGDRTRIGLWTPQIGIAGGRGGAHVHYAMQVDDATYDAMVGRLRERGHDLEERVFRSYDASRAAYVTDPDGNVVELWTWDVGRHLERPPPGSRRREAADE
jgi:catechol 2,3-dioxygenase-like lactoylglutathione lyase family enzyme